MPEKSVEKLIRKGIQPSAQRAAVADYVLFTDEHPSIDQAWKRVKEKFPIISRATVYNTINLFVEKGLLKELALTEGKSVYDPRIDRHHHFIDEQTGRIYDLPWESMEISKMKLPAAYKIREYQVVLRGRNKINHPAP